jgi:GNAT superfamily N-acetyltransferase
MNVQFREVTSRDAAALAHVLIVGIGTTFRGIVPSQCLTFTEAESAANWQRTLDKPLPDGEFIEVVEQEGEVVAYAWGGPSRDDSIYRGELKQIIVLPSHWGHGIGRSLVQRVASRLADEQQIRSLRVEVLRCNPNRAFYERLGAQYISERPHDWDGVVMPMCLYGWKDTSRLTARAP